MTYLLFFQPIILTHWKPVKCKDCPCQITNLKHHSPMMSINQGFILNIVVIDRLFDLLSYGSIIPLILVSFTGPLDQKLLKLKLLLF